MSDLDNILQKAVTSVPDGVAAGYVDLSSGMLLGLPGGSPGAKSVSAMLRCRALRCAHHRDACLP
jgi:hypothetical protein